MNAAPSASIELANAAAWPRVKLGEVCRVINGIWKGTKPPFKNVGVIRATNFTTQCDFSLNNTAYIDVEESKFATRRLCGGDLIVEKAGGGPGLPVGRCVYFDIQDGEYTVSNFTSILRVVDTNAVESKFLWRYLTAQYFQGATEHIQSNATGIHNLDFKAYLNQLIPLPSLSVQREIVSRLDAELAKADRMREEFLAIAENAAARFRAILAETFEGGEAGDSWPRKKLGEECVLKSGFTPKPSEIVDKGAIPYFRIASMNEPENEREMKKPIGFYIGTNRRRFPKGSLVFPKNGGAAQTHKIRYLAEDSIVDLNTGVFLPNKGLNTDYLFYWFSALPIERVLVTGTLPFVDFPRLSQQTIPLPPLSVQREIVARLDAARAECDRAEALARKGAEECAGFRAALLKEAFE